MKRPQWMTVLVALAGTAGLFFATQGSLFGAYKRTTPAAAAGEGAPAASNFSIDSLLNHARTHLSPEQATRLAFLESSISRGDVQEQQIHIYHQLAGFWRDTVRAIEPEEWYEPYAWYTAQAARLENSEKSLTFAARLFLNALRQDGGESLRRWRAEQAKELYDRSLKLNGSNDSARVELGEVYLYGGLSTPMEGIGLMRAVADRDSTNAYAQLALGRASMMSGQQDRAIERFERVAALEPDNLEAVLLVADLHERAGRKTEAVVWYRRSLPLVKEEQLKTEVERRISELTR